MKNKNTAILITVFIVIFMFITLLLGISGHIPFLGKGISLIFAVILIIFTVAFFAVITILRRRK